MKDGFLKAAAFSPALRVADCTYNAQQILADVQAAAARGVKLAVFPEIRSAAEVNGREHQCLVHRKDSVAVAADALFVADCLADCSSEHDTGVLDRVVAVYIKISVYRNGKVEKTVAGKAVEHMVKKADAGVDVALSRSIQI